jgi:hypothetical protein
MSDDIIAHARLASGYVPGLTDQSVTGPNGASIQTAVLENCTVTRTITLNPLLVIHGSYDIIIGGNGPAPVGIGGVNQPTLVGNPVVVDQGRVIITKRGPAGAQVGTILYGDSLAPPNRNPQLVRVTFNASADIEHALEDADFDFSIEYVESPLTSP